MARRVSEGVSLNPSLTHFEVALFALHEGIQPEGPLAGGWLIPEG